MFSFFLRCLKRSLSAQSECVNHGERLQQCFPLALAGKFVQEDIRAEKERLHVDIQVCSMLCHRIVLSLWCWGNFLTPSVSSYFQTIKKKNKQKSKKKYLLHSFMQASTVYGGIFPFHLFSCVQAGITFLPWVCFCTSTVRLWPNWNKAARCPWWRC